MSSGDIDVLHIGDIVLATFPFADHSVTKLRPAVLVSALPKDAWLVMYATSSTKNQTEYDVILEPSTENNLKVPSLARVNRLTVIAGNMIERQLGTLTKSEKEEIGEKLSLLQTEFVGE